MTSENSDPGLDEVKKQQRKKNTHLTLFIICLIISIVMWLMIKLSREYSTTVLFSVRYTGLQNQNTILPGSDSILFINLQTTGYNILFRQIFHQNYKLEVDLSRYLPKHRGKNFETDVDVRELIPDISGNFYSKETISSYLPQILKVKLDKAYTKLVPVIPDVSISFIKDYGLYHKMYFSPDSIMVSGDREKLKHIDFVKTQQQNFTNLASNVSLTVKLINNNPSEIRFSSEYIKLFIPVVEVTEHSLEIPLKLDSLKSTGTITAEPDKVMVQYLVCKPDSNKIRVDSFDLALDMSDVQRNKAKVTVRRSPSYVKILRIEPEYVSITSFR